MIIGLPDKEDVSNINLDNSIKGIVNRIISKNYYLNGSPCQ